MNTFEHSLDSGTLLADPATSEATLECSDMNKNDNQLNSIGPQPPGFCFGFLAKREEDQKTSHNFLTINLL